MENELKQYLNIRIKKGDYDSTIISLFDKKHKQEIKKIRYENEKEFVRKLMECIPAEYLKSDMVVNASNLKGKFISLFFPFKKYDMLKITFFPSYVKCNIMYYHYLNPYLNDDVYEKYNMEKEILNSHEENNECFSFRYLDKNIRNYFNQLLTIENESYKKSASVLNINIDNRCMNKLIKSFLYMYDYKNINVINLF